MALTKSLLPVITPTHAVPYDTLSAFALAQVIAATGYLNNVNLQVPTGPGRMEGYWVLDISSVNIATGDEFYKFFLLGSNDIAFGNGNVEILATHDIAATAALRLLPTIAAASPTIPVTGLNATRHVIPYSNEMGDFTFVYLQAYVLMGGTGPTVTCSSWLTYDTSN